MNPPVKKPGAAPTPPPAARKPAAAPAAPTEAATPSTRPATEPDRVEPNRSVAGFRDSDPRPKPTSKIENVLLSELTPERELTARVERLDEATVDVYVDALKEEGRELPPIDLFRDEAGALWLGDGVHRVEAHRRAGRATIRANVGDGGRLAALRHAAGANHAQGLRRTREDRPGR